MARAQVKKKTKAKVKPVRKAVKKPAPKPAKKAAKAVPKKILQMKKVSAKAAPAKTAKAGKPSSLAVGSAIPDFSMPSTRIGKISLADLKGKPFVLYFYPKDDTSGCTAEACEFRNSLSVFNNLGLTVIGVSKDSLESHEKFARKYNLNFPLAFDETGVCEKMGTWAQKSMYGRSYMGIERTTFLVDRKGIIRNIWRKVSVSGHVDEVKKAAEAL